MSRMRLVAAGVAITAAITATLVLGPAAAQGMCVSPSGAGAAPYQGGPSHGPECRGAGGSRNEPLELRGSGHKPGFVGHWENGACASVTGWAEPHHRNAHGVDFTFY